MDLQDNEDMMVVNMVRKNYEENDKKCMITLDSGANISVPPRSPAGVGARQDGRDELKIVDVQRLNVRARSNTR